MTVWRSFGAADAGVVYIAAVADKDKLEILRIPAEVNLAARSARRHRSGHREGHGDGARLRRFLLTARQGAAGGDGPAPWRRHLHGAVPAV
jgi:hypothetical protein